MCATGASLISNCVQAEDAAVALRSAAAGAARTPSRKGHLSQQKLEPVFFKNIFFGCCCCCCCFLPASTADRTDSAETPALTCKSMEGEFLEGELTLGKEPARNVEIGPMPSCTWGAIESPFSCRSSKKEKKRTEKKSREISDGRRSVSDPASMADLVRDINRRTNCDGRCEVFCLFVKDQLVVEQRNGNQNRWKGHSTECGANFATRCES